MKKLLIVAAILCITGCQTRIGDFTVASTKNMDIKKSLHRVDESKRLKGVDTRHVIIIFPTSLGPNMKQAMDNAIEKSPGAVGLSNVVVYHGSWYIPFIYGQEYFTVMGNPVYEVAK